MSFATTATIVTIVLSGIVFYLSGFILIQHYRAIRAGASPLPRHVLAMAVSYVGLVVSLLTNERDFQTRFWIYAPSLALGAYGLWIMSRFQRRLASGH